MNINSSDSLTNVVDSYIGKKSLCMLLLASSILFYTMAKTNKRIIPKFYTLTISILLILYAVFLGSFSLYEFIFHINDISKSQYYTNSMNNRNLINVKYFYIFIGSFFIFLFTFIAYVIIKFDK